jgi:hypothetical protein
MHYCIKCNIIYFMSQHKYCIPNLGVHIYTFHAQSLNDKKNSMFIKMNAKIKNYYFSVLVKSSFSNLWVLL